MELIDFAWHRCIDGYRVERFDDDPEELFRYGVLISVSGRFEPYRPTEFPALFQQFADVPHSTAGMTDFANRFGLLSGERRRPSYRMSCIVVHSLLAYHRDIRWAIARVQAGKLRSVVHHYNEVGEDPGFGRCRTELRMQPDGKISLVFVPSSLIEFLWVQFARHVGYGAKLLRCERCATPFSTGSGTGRRETAKFCSNRCKVASFRQRKAAT
jgi:hypothetical protein